MRSCTLCGVVRNPVFPCVRVCELEQHHLCESTDHAIDQVVSTVRVAVDSLPLAGSRMKARKELLEILVRFSGTQNWYLFNFGRFPVQKYEGFLISFLFQRRALCMAIDYGKLTVLGVLAPHVFDLQVPCGQAIVENWELNEGSRAFSFSRLYYGKTVFVHHLRGDHGRTGPFLSAHVTDPGTIPYALAQFTHPLHPPEAQPYVARDPVPGPGALEHVPGPVPVEDQRVPEGNPEGESSPEGSEGNEEDEGQGN